MRGELTFHLNSKEHRYLRGVGGVGQSWFFLAVRSAPPYKRRTTCVDTSEMFVTMLMEEVMSYLKEQVFFRIVVHHSRRRQVWIRLLPEVYKTAKPTKGKAATELISEGEAVT
ncbi:unnamed protein product [Pleuronectes platessa]|uniref:Uncharacterized protein n=1 Tax=Pleuronectes platessa TaxID=8262 RepID=A0A9N7YX59_PLEPL|nr:unnamed protein product [Pleuronectes platessa]